MLTSAALLAVFNFSGPELMIVLAILLLLFGSSKLPALARGLGQSIKEFKKSAKEEDPAELKAPVAPAAPAEAKKPETAGTHGSN